MITEPGQATIVPWKAEGDSAEVVAQLSEAGVLVRDLPGLGWVRASCGFWTSEEDLDRLLAALGRSAGRAPPAIGRIAATTFRMWSSSSSPSSSAPR